MISKSIKGDNLKKYITEWWPKVSMLPLWWCTHVWSLMRKASIVWKLWPCLWFFQVHKGRKSNQIALKSYALWSECSQCNVKSLLSVMRITWLLYGRDMLKASNIIQKAICRKVTTPLAVMCSNEIKLFELIWKRVYWEIFLLKKLKSNYRSRRQRFFKIRYLVVLVPMGIILASNF